MSAAEITVSQVIAAVADMGSVGVLALMCYWFVQGKIVSKHFVDQTQEEFRKRQEFLISTMKDAIREAVKEGMLEASGEMARSLPCVMRSSKETGD